MTTAVTSLRFSVSELSGRPCTVHEQVSIYVCIMDRFTFMLSTEQFESEIGLDPRIVLVQWKAAPLHKHEDRSL